MEKSTFVGHSKGVGIGTNLDLIEQGKGNVLKATFNAVVFTKPIQILNIPIANTLRFAIQKASLFRSPLYY